MFETKNKIFKFGFTGTSELVKEEQAITLTKVIKKIKSKANVEHHNGQCINSDELCFDLVQKYIPHAKIVMHPPINTSKMFKIRIPYNVESRKPLDYLKRNMQIVAESDFLVATPKSVKEELRSGTWATIRYARIAQMPIIIIFPNGSIRKEGFK